VNSLCHRDYSNYKSNEIAIYKDRIEIYNPGKFTEDYSPEDFIRGYGKSVLRNRLIANVLYLSKDIEKWGSGLKRINDECIKNNVKVEFKKLKSGFSIIFYRKSEKIDANDTINDTIKINRTQKIILREIGKIQK